MNIPPDEFYKFSWREFFLKLHGFTKSEYKQLEHTRLISYITAATHYKGKSRFPSITKWMPLPTDRKSDLDVDKMKLVWDKINKKDGTNS